MNRPSASSRRARLLHKVWLLACCAVVLCVAAIALSGSHAIGYSTTSRWPHDAYQITVANGVFIAERMTLPAGVTISGGPIWLPIHQWSISDQFMPEFFNDAATCGAAIIPFNNPLLLSALLIAGLWKWRRLEKPGMCPRCGYQVFDLPGPTCPECGRTSTLSAR